VISCPELNDALNLFILEATYIKSIYLFIFIIETTYTKWLYDKLTYSQESLGIILFCRISKPIYVHKFSLKVSRIGVEEGDKNVHQTLEED
jgi:hypothetical protein